MTFQELAVNAGNFMEETTRKVTPKNDAIQETSTVTLPQTSILGKKYCIFYPTETKVIFNQRPSSVKF